MVCCCVPCGASTPDPASPVRSVHGDCVEHDDRDTLTSASLFRPAKRSWCAALCCGKRPLCHRPSTVAKTFMPLLVDPATDMTPWQKLWFRDSFLRYVQRIDRVSLGARRRFKNIRWCLISLGVLISGLVLIKDSVQLASHATVQNVVFGLTVGIAILNNFVTAMLTDLKLAERAVLFYRGSTHMQAMGHTFLTRTQRYKAFDSCSAAFRTFARDVEMAKLLIASENISLMSSAKEPRPEHRATRSRQTWVTMMEPLSGKEAVEMNETVGYAPVVTYDPDADEEGGVFVDDDTDAESKGQSDGTGMPFPGTPSVGAPRTPPSPMSDWL